MALANIKTHRGLLLGLLAILIAITAIIGALTQTYWLTAYSYQGEFPNIKVNAALCLLLSGVGLISIQVNNVKTAYIAAGLSLLIALVAVFEHLTNTISGLNEFAIQVHWPGEIPGLMPLATTTTIILCNLIIVTYRRAKNNETLYAALLLLLSINPLIAVTTYLFGYKPQNAGNAYSILSLPALFGFISILAGLVLSNQRANIYALWTHSDAPAKEFRSMNGKIFATTLIQGLLLVLLIQKNLIMPNTGIIIMSVTTIILTIAFQAALFKKIKRWLNDLKNQHPKTHNLETALFDALEFSNDGILILNKEGTILHANSGCENIFNWPKNALPGNSVEMLIPEQYREKHPQFRQQFIANKQQSAHNVDGSIIALTKDGVEKPVAISLSKQKTKDDSGFVVALVRELSKTEAELANLRISAKIDPFTGILNRDEFNKYCENLHNCYSRHDDKQLCVMYFDIDSIKMVNDKFGYEAGDCTLINFVKTIQRNIRSNDKLYRYDGDTFFLISTTLDSNEAIIVAERIRTSVKINPTTYNENTIYITCTIIVHTTNNTLIDKHKIIAETEAKIAEIKVKSKDQKSQHRDQVITLN